MRTMVDSTAAADALAVPADLYAGYVDGRFANAAQLLVSGKPVVTISAVGAVVANVGDCEPGCMWPASSVVRWVQWVRSQGLVPIVYCGLANLSTIVAAFRAAGVDLPLFWTAHYNNVEHICSPTCRFPIPAGVVIIATQYGGDLVGHYDVSLVTDLWPDGGFHPDSAGAQLLLLQQEDELYMIQGPNRGIAVVGANYFKQLDGPEVNTAIAMLGAPKITDDAGFDFAKSIAIGGTSPVKYDAIHVIDADPSKPSGEAGKVAVNFGRGFKHVDADTDAMLRRHNMYAGAGPRDVLAPEYHWYVNGGDDSDGGEDAAMLGTQQQVLAQGSAIAAGVAAIATKLSASPQPAAAPAPQPDLTALAAKVDEVSEAQRKTLSVLTASAQAVVTTAGGQA